MSWWLKVLVERQTTMRKIEGSIPDRVKSQGLKITKENVLPLKLHLQMIRRRPRLPHLQCNMVSRGRKRTNTLIEKSSARISLASSVLHGPQETLKNPHTYH